MQSPDVGALSGADRTAPSVLGRLVVQVRAGPARLRQIRRRILVRGQSDDDAPTIQRHAGSIAVRLAVDDDLVDAGGKAHPDAAVAVALGPGDEVAAVLQPDSVAAVLVTVLEVTPLQQSSIWIPSPPFWFIWLSTTE